MIQVLAIYQTVYWTCGDGCCSDSTKEVRIYSRSSSSSNWRLLQEYDKMKIWDEEDWVKDRLKDLKIDIKPMSMNFQVVRGYDRDEDQESSWPDPSGYNDDFVKKSTEYGMNTRAEIVAYLVEGCGMTHAELSILTDDDLEMALAEKG